MSLARDFIQQLEELQRTTPRPAIINIKSENSDYCTHSDGNKDCYLLFAANFNRDCLYGGIILNSEDCVDCEVVDRCRHCYMLVDAEDCYDCRFSQDLKNCNECYFCYNGVGSHHCFGSTNLRQASYVWFNEPLSKDEYMRRLSAFDFKDARQVDEAFKAMEREKLKVPHVYSHQSQSENCVGDYITHSKDCFCCFNTHFGEDNLYLDYCYNSKDLVDCMFVDGAEFSYECFSYGLGSYNCNFSNYARGSSDLEYCELCFSCKNCFGCVGLQRKEYHILNKPHSPEDYHKKVAEIKEALRKEGLYGRYHLPSTYRFEDTAAAQ